MLKNTRSRNIIKNYLLESNEPLSAQNIFDALKDKNITLSSIYRTLEAFYDNNIVIKDLSSGVAKYTIKRNSHTHYLKCKHCNKSTAIDYCPYHQANKRIKTLADFEVDEHNIVIYGTCKDCKKSHKHNSHCQH